MLDPYRACLGLAKRRRRARRGRCTSNRRCSGYRARRQSVEVGRRAARIDAGTVIVATGDPTADFRALRRHVTPLHRYFVLTEPLSGRHAPRQIGARVALRDRRDPPHEIRWTQDDRLLVAGADQPRVSRPPRVRRRWCSAPVN